MTAHVLETLEELNPDTFTAACESLWGNGVPSAADVILGNLETRAVSGVPSAEVSAVKAATQTRDEDAHPSNICAP